jgi:hypothetical protein
MSDLEYKEKYLKYKNKYLTLKSQLDAQNPIQNEIQTQAQLGGNYFYRGTYVFFLNKYQTDKVKTETGKIIQSRIINNFDNFTDQLGNCAYFLRVGSTTTGYDINHDFDTIYPNKSSLGAIGTSLSLSAANLGDKILQGFGNIFSKKSAQSTEPDTVNKVGGGEHIPFEIKYLCYYKRIPLSSIGFGIDFKGFKYTSEVEDSKNLELLVKGINKNIIVPDQNGGNQISTVLIINKLGNTTKDAEIVRRYDITYNSNNFDTFTISEIKY